MSNIRNTVLSLLVAGVSLGAAAQTAAEHQQHHPGGTPAAAAAKTAPAPQAMDPAQMANREQQMKAMQAMRDKMMNAKTPAERQALMEEHMKSMHEGMAMMKCMKDMKGMGGMHGKAGMPGMSGKKDMPMDISKHHQMMEMRMDMMQTMMEMMMQRMPGGSMPPAAK